jgi:hypothetical protein
MKKRYVVTANVYIPGHVCAKMQIEFLILFYFNNKRRVVVSHAFSVFARVCARL